MPDLHAPNLQQGDNHAPYLQASTGTVTAAAVIPGGAPNPGGEGTVTAGSIGVSRIQSFTVEGNGAKLNYVLKHNLKSQFVSATTIAVATGRQVTGAEVKILNENEIEIVFGSLAAKEVYRVQVDG
jgi:hypothetical protein